MNCRLGALLLFAFLISTVATIGYTFTSFASTNEEPSKRIAFHDEMRKLWEDHIT